MSKVNKMIQFIEGRIHFAIHYGERECTPSIDDQTIMMSINDWTSIRIII